MKILTRRLLFWAPRAVCIAFAIFLSIFALDVFGEGYGFWKTALALLMHLIPVYIVLIVLALAWRWEWIGAVGFAGLPWWYTSRFAQHHPGWIVGIAGPMVVIAALFLANWLKHDELRVRPQV
jgi:lysylphosphatidylglycerol synthetase-like protein (DUF2156 family)